MKEEIEKTLDEISGTLSKTDGEVRIVLDSLVEDIKFLKSRLNQRVEYEHNVTDSKIQVVGNAKIKKTGVLLSTSLVPLPGAKGIDIIPFAMIKPDDGTNIVISNSFRLLD